MNKKNEFRLWTLKDVEYKNIKQMIDKKIDKKEDTNLEKIIDELLIKLKTAGKMLKLSGEIAERYKKENEDLKQQLSEVKTLNRDEVEKIVKRIYPLYPPLNTKNITYEEAITAICKLAKPSLKSLSRKLMINNAI